MLYQVDRHLPYQEYQWDENRVKETIQEILHSTYTCLDQKTSLWPIHPKDDYPEAPRFLTDFYYGAAGVLWAIHELTEFSHSIHPLPAIDQILVEHFNSSEEPNDSPFCGELGIRFVKQMIAPEAENSKALKALIHRAANNTHREILFGGPGALAMSHLLWKAGDESYREVCRDVGKTILSQREVDQSSDTRIWTQQFSVKRKFIGAAHGNVGNFGVLIRALRDLGDESTVGELIHDVEKFLSHYALTEGGLTNWRRGFDDSEYSSLTVVHWCHGATGVVTDLSKCISPSEAPILDQLFLQATNLIWKAGPLEKGVSLCHGTSGSGLACLTFFERTGDQLWLDRARGLAMYACEQYRSEVSKFKLGRFSLWTGDLGVAIFLRDLLRTRASLPGLT